MKRTSFKTRCMALVLALGMIIPNVNWAALRVSAAEGDEKVITAGELVAKNYELTDAEDALLNSGLVVGDSYTYTVPKDADGLVTIDTEKITAGEYGNWVPVSAEIIADNESKGMYYFEAGTNEVEYDYDGKAFSVQVTYTYDVEVAEDTQNVLLNAAAELKSSLDEMKAAYAASDANLGTVASAMDVLVRLADGIPAASWLTLQFGEEAQKAVYALQAEMADDNTLKLQEMNAAYAASASKVQYLIENGAEYKEAIANTYAYLKAIADDKGVTGNSNVDSYFAGNDQTMGTQWSAFKNIVGATVSGLEPVANADAWNTASVKSGLTAAEYAEIDTLVAGAASTATAVTVKNPLNAEVAVVKANANMYDVTVNVVLYTVNEKDSQELKANAIDPMTITLEENTSAADVVAAVTASGIEDQAKKEWGDTYVADGYVRTATVLTEALTKDIAYTIEYKPVDCTVTYGYTTDAPTTVPYGYQMTLPAHEDATKAYDYEVNGEIMAQDTVYTVVGATEISRSAGKAYTFFSMYSIVADNFGNDAAKAILESGAVLGDVTINVRKPEASDAADLLKLENGELTGADYVSNYKNYNWNPYTYGTNGDENAFNGNTADWAEESAKVQYILKLKDVIDAQAALDLAVTLEEEAAAQIGALDRLYGHMGTMAELNKTKLGALNGVIGVTDLNDDPAKNEELKAYFSNIVGNIINKNVDSNNNLKIYNMLVQYETNGLRYFYENSQAVIAEINALSENLTGMMADSEKTAALEILCNAAGYPQYVDSIANMEQIMAEVKRDLQAPNAAIDLTSANLGKLIAALTDENAAAVINTVDVPYLVSDSLTVKDSSKTMISVTVKANGKTATYSSKLFSPADIIDQATINDLKAQVEAFALDQLGANLAYYEYTVEGSLDGLVGQLLGEDLFVTYTYAPKEYTVKIEGEADQTISISNLEVALPKHAQSPNYEYEYKIGEEAPTKASFYTFTTAQLDTLFVNDAYTISREEINVAVNDFEDVIANLNGKSENEYVITEDENGMTLTANVSDLMGFALDMTDTGYSYIALDGKKLMGFNEELNLPEIYLQVLIDAMLQDDNFSNEMLIDLGKNGGGVVLTADMYMSYDEPAQTFALRSTQVDLSVGCKFVLNLVSVPEEMLTLSNALEAVKAYVSFESNEQTGELDVDLTLPEKVYEAYLTALLITGNVDKSDVKAINNEIAYKFLRDYVDVVTQSEATTTTFQNTLRKLDNAVNDKTDYDLPDYVLTNYEKYYQKVKAALNEGVNPEIIATPDVCEVTGSASGNNIKKLADLLGFDLSTYETFIVEIRDNGSVTAHANVELTNTSKDFEAAVLDVRNDEIMNKADFTSNLEQRAKEIEGAAVIVLLDDVIGNLTFDATTILDLNGKTLTGNITSNKNLLIVDSSLNNDKAGKVTGTISGTATIIGGYYDDPSAKAFVKDGYEMTAEGQVQNVLYTLSTDGNGGLAFDINTDIMEENIDRYTVFAAELAADVAVDLVANYYTSAALNVMVDDATNQDDGFVAGWKKIYGVNFDDIVDLVESDSIPTDLLNKALSFVSLPNLSTVVNMVTADLLDLDAIQAALNSNGTQAIASYDLQIAPWKIEVEHVTDEDYLTVGVVANEELAKSIGINLYISGDNYTDEMAEAIAYLDKIVVEENGETFFRLVDVEELTYGNKNFNLTGGAKARVHLDLSDYTTYMAVIMAHGNPAKEQAIIDAIGDDAALKAIFDEFTVEEVFNAVKVLNRKDSLVDIAAGYGITVEPNKYLEKALVLSLSATGKVLERLEITGNDATLGALDPDGDGIYEYGPKSVSKEGNVSKRGYGVNYDLTTAEATIIIDLFNDDCLWGDADHDNDVDYVDAMLILQEDVDLLNGREICTNTIFVEGYGIIRKLDVNGDGEVNYVDAMLDMQHDTDIIQMFPVEE